MPLSTRLRLALTWECLLCAVLLAPLQALAQTAPAAGPGAAGAAPAAVPATAPAATPRRQRLALVVGIGSLGPRVVLESASRDVQAVTSALRAAGFEVMLRENVSGADLRAALKDFRDRLREDGVGLVYYTGLAAQVDGRNLLLPADLTLNETLGAPAVATVLRAAGVPLQGAADALAGPADSPRMLLLDAAYRHPALARLTPPGLARVRLAPNTMALLGHAPGALQDLPAVTPLPSPPPKDPAELAATRFARVVVDALAAPRITGPEALRAIRLAVVDSSGGLSQPWLAGDTQGRDHLADAALLEAPVASVAAAATPVGAAIIAAAEAVAAESERRIAGGRTAAAPGGQGERPVFQARANSFGHAEGDILSYQLTDTRKDELLLSYITTIEEVRPDGVLVANGGEVQMDAQGRLKLQRFADGSQSQFQPVQDLWWARPQAGENRAVAFQEEYVRADKSSGHIDWRGTAQVGTLRRLETPAGEFEVLPIKITGQRIDTPAGGAPLIGSFARTVWFSPKLGIPVAVEIEDTDPLGRSLRRERLELTHAQQARTAQ